MLNYGWLNVGSFVLGLIAWIIPVFSIIQRKKRGSSNSIMTLLSMGACTIALWFQISYNNYLVNIQDWAALLDTTSTLNWVAAVLLVVTIILNIINIIVYRNTRSD